MALRTGAEYLQALRDGREVYLDGRRVKDVTTEPGLSIVAHTFARMYDLVAQNQEAMTCLDEEGQRISGTWLQPRDRDQLGWRRLFTETIARHTGGLFGRPQDYVPLFHLGLLDVKIDFSRGDKRFEQNIERYWRHARDKDLMLSHGFVDVQSHPSRAINETVVPRIVARNADGIVVRGVKTVATFATHADEVLIGSLPRTGLTEDHVVYFSIPIATPGLRVVARTVYGTGNAFDHPVSQYGDENDCISSSTTCSYRGSACSASPTRSSVPRSSRASPSGRTGVFSFAWRSRPRCSLDCMRSSLRCWAAPSSRSRRRQWARF